jgi:ribokinase
VNKQVITIGGAMQDIFIEYPCTDLLQLESVTRPHRFVLLEEGKKLIVDHLIYKTGGGATNSAVSLSKLGFDTTLFCMIGND